MMKFSHQPDKPRADAQYVSRFIDQDFLLSCDAAVELYEIHARDLPIVDYHCHLSPEAIARDHRFANMTELWLAGDHYKWRAMRTAGVDERFCTGDATDREKFQKWAETVSKTLRNPLYHWTHMELARPFGIRDRVLNDETAESIWNECNARLAEPEFSCPGLMRQFDVRVVCTTDDPADDLAAHLAIAADKDFKIQVLPTWRPDKVLALDQLAVPKIFNEYIDRLGVCAGIEISTYDQLLEALAKRHAFFAECGCRLSDHGLENIDVEPYTLVDVRAAFSRLRSGHELTASEAALYRSALLYELARMDHAAGWAQQFHLGALRNQNLRALKTLGADAGFDSIGPALDVRAIARFLGRLDADGVLAKTILYNLNPADNEMIATMIGNFQDGKTPGKIQYGSAWWFLDQLDGMKRQIDALSNMGLLSQFVGMVTDSRSFVSYVRHDYFRRLLCDILGREMEAGLIPRDIELVGGMVRDICYHNARRYFGFDVKGPLDNTSAIQ